MRLLVLAVRAERVLHVLDRILAHPDPSSPGEGFDLADQFVELAGTAAAVQALEGQHVGTVLLESGDARLRGRPPISPLGVLPVTTLTPQSKSSGPRKAAMPMYRDPGLTARILGGSLGILLK